MEHLLDFFDRYVRGRSEALVYDDGFRRWSYTHDELRAAAERFARRLTEAGLTAGDRLLIWSDSRPEWVAAFWGCVLVGIAVIPVDASASPDLVDRIVTFEIRRWVEEGRPARSGGERTPTGDVERLVAKYVKDRIVTPDTTLDELGLTLLDRIELMMALEDQARVTLSETAMSEAQPVASCDCCRDGEGVLRRALPPRTPHAQGTADNECHLLPRRAVLQCVPATTEGAGSAADAALHGRSGDGGLFDFDLSGRVSHRTGRDQSVSARRRHSWLEAASARCNQCGS